MVNSSVETVRHHFMKQAQVTDVTGPNDIHVDVYHGLIVMDMTTMV